jgi:hypothetical protein
LGSPQFGISLFGSPRFGTARFGFPPIEPDISLSKVATSSLIWLATASACGPTICLVYIPPGRSITTVLPSTIAFVPTVMTIGGQETTSIVLHGSIRFALYKCFEF